MPYTLGNLNTGADLLARGISGAGAGIGSGFKHWSDNIRSDKLLEYYKTRDATDDTRQDKALNFQISDTEARRKREDEEAGKLGTAIDLGAGYRGVLTGPRSLSVIAPEEKPFVPDPETLNTLQKNGYLYAPQSRHGGSIVPMKPNAGGAVPPVTEQDGYFYDGARWRQKTGQGTKPMDAADAATLQAGVTELDRINREIADHQAQIAQGDKHYGFLNFNSREAAVQDLLTRKKGLEAKLGAMGPRGRTAPSTAPAEPAAPAAPAMPAPAARPQLGAPPRTVSPAPTPPLRPAPTAVQEIAGGGALPANPTPAPAANAPSVLPQLPMTTGLAPQAPPAAPAAPTAPANPAAVTPAAPAQAQPQGNLAVDPARMLQEAKRAIELGADKGKVLQRLQQFGVNTAGL